MKEHPILFSGPMVRAILEGRKTQTRRVVKAQPNVTTPTDASWRDAKCDLWRNATQYARDCCPYGVPGNRLWVRETWARALWSGFCAPLERYESGSAYKGALYAATPHPDYNCSKWKPSIHMPRWASRLTLEVVSVRVERVREISEADARAEGLPLPEQAQNAGGMSAGRHFEYLWQDINGKREGCAWSDNPWVWVVEFRRPA